MSNTNFLDLDQSSLNHNDFRESAKDKLNRFAKSFFDSIQVIVVALAAVVLVYLFVASFNIVDGESMIPNFQSREVIISEKLTLNFGTLHRGDVIVFQAPTGSDFIKRIIGLPGDKVMVKDGKVYINGTPITENYLSDDNKYILPGTVYTEGQEIQTPGDSYFVMGDNRKNSLDSRNIGPIGKDKIRGKAWLIFWPLDKFQIVPHQNYPELSK